MRDSGPAMMSGVLLYPLFRLDLTVTDIAALLGMVFGTAGLVLGILNYLRDRPVIAVRLQWDMKITGNRMYPPDKYCGVITVANIGRRAIYISHASIKLPKGYDKNYLVLWEGLKGQKLGEGDPPVDYVLSQEDLGKYGKDWQKLRALVIDTSGREYYSEVPRDRPSWAK